MGVRLGDGREARYPSLDGEGIAAGPHQERPDLTWLELADRFGLDVALSLQNSAAHAELEHIATECELVDTLLVHTLVRREVR